jgi:hypothetical protein
MYRSRIKTPVLLPPVVTAQNDQVKNIVLLAEKQTQILSIMSAYIKGQAERDPTYTALKVLKESIT